MLSNRHCKKIDEMIASKRQVLGEVEKQLFSDSGKINYVSYAIMMAMIMELNDLEKLKKVN